MYIKHSCLPIRRYNVETHKCVSTLYMYGYIAHLKRNLRCRNSSAFNNSFVDTHTRTHIDKSTCFACTYLICRVAAFHFNFFSIMTISTSDSLQIHEQATTHNQTYMYVCTFM